MKMKKCLWMTLSLMICLTYQVFAQPYYYYSDAKEAEKFWRFNLQTNINELFYTDTVCCAKLESWDPTQSWVFTYGDAGGREYPVFVADVINTNNIGVNHRFPEQDTTQKIGRVHFERHRLFDDPSQPVGKVQSFTRFYNLSRDGRSILDGIVYNPVKNVFYVTWTTDFLRSDYSGLWDSLFIFQKTAVYDASTFKVLDTLPVPPAWITSISSVSADGNYLYSENRDNQKCRAIGKYSLFTQQLIINRKLSDIYVPGGYDVADSKKGNYLLCFLYPRQQMEDKKFAVYNIDKDTVYGLIPFPLAEHSYLSSNGKYVIIEETPWIIEKTSRHSNYKDLHPGRISVFDGKTGTILQNLNLPPDGKVLVFDNYPNMLYYYLPKEERSVNIDLSKLINIISLSPAIAYVGGGTVTLSVTGKNFVSGSTVFWNGTAKSTTFIKDTLLQASIIVSDLAAVDSPVVTVKNPDGSAESNGIHFYIKPQPQVTGCVIKFVNSSGMILTSGTLQYYEGAWKDAINNNDGTFTITTNQKTLSLRMTYEYGTQTKSNVPVGIDTVVFQTVNTQIQLQNSSGALIDTGTVQYYAGAWRNFGTTTNGIAAKELLPNTYSFRMTYAYTSKDKQQDIGTNPTVIFQTVNAAVQLQNSQSSLMDQGTVQYYSGAWREFGTTANGVANKELLPNNYSFRMIYAYASKDKQQEIGTNPIVVFQTVNAAVQLQNSQGSLMDQGTVQYYSGAWRSFGTTANGVANKELLPNNYSFRMIYAFASKDKQQDIGTNSTVVFQTVNAAVQLKNSQGSLMDQGTVQYYSGAWRDFGTTTNGTAAKELLPNNYSFRMTYSYASKDKQQDIGTNPTVVFQTVNAIVQLKNSQASLIDQGTVQYYSGAWRSFGTTSGGTANKELLPNNYSFRMTHEYISMDKSQDISTNNTVSFSTVLCTVRVRNAQNQPVDNAQASYYSGAWRQIGNTVNGEVTKELLPVNLTFRVKLGTVQQDKAQNLSTNNVVEFSLP